MVIQNKHGDFSVKGEVRVSNSEINCGTFNWWAGWSIIRLVVSYQLAESRSQGSYTTR